MENLPVDIQCKINAAIEQALLLNDKISTSEAVTAAIAHALQAELSPAKPSKPIDTSSAEAFNADMTAKGMAAMTISLIGLGDELGYFRSLLVQPKSAADLAADTECDARYTQEWCLTMTASDLLTYNEGDDTFAVTSTIASCVQQHQDPHGLIWATILPVAVDGRETLVQAFRTGSGIDWRDRDPRLIQTTCNYFKPLYENLLVAALPADIQATMSQPGAVLADVGCGKGISSCILAQAFPNAQIHGIDYSEPSIQQATEMAAAQQLTNVTFAVQDARDFGTPDTADVACFLDCLHDMCVARQAAQRVAHVLKPGGTCFLIEPMAAETNHVLAQCALPTAATYGAFSCHMCLCCAKCNDGDALGTLCPTQTFRDIFLQAGFASFENVPNPVNEVGFRFLVAKK